MTRNPHAGPKGTTSRPWARPGPTPGLFPSRTIPGATATKHTNCAPAGARHTDPNGPQGKALQRLTQVPDHQRPGMSGNMLRVFSSLSQRATFKSDWPQGGLRKRYNVGECSRWRPTVFLVWDKWLPATRKPHATRAPCHPLTLNTHHQPASMGQLSISYTHGPPKAG